MYISAELARFCPTTALTYNMHSQTVLWTGILADDLDMPADVREHHEQRRRELYRWILDDGAIMSQPLSEGIARGATAGVATTATPAPGGFLVNGRKVFASLAGAAARLQLHLPRPRRGGPALPLGARRQPGVEIVGDWDTLGMRGTDSRTLVFKDAFVAADDELLPTGLLRPARGALAARLPDAHADLHRAHARRRRLRAGLPRQQRRRPASPLAATCRPKQWAWAEIQIAWERSRSLWECAVAEAGLDPSPEQLRRAWAASYTAMETAPAVAALAIRACGGGSLMRNLPLEQHYRDARCGSRHAALERRGVPRAARPLRPLRRARGSPPCLSRATSTRRRSRGARPAPGRSCCSCTDSGRRAPASIRSSRRSPPRYRCVAWDMPGYGASPAARRRALVRAPGRCRRRADRHARRAQRAHLAGLSMGGQIALHTALRHPGCVRSLALLDSSPAFGLDGTDPEAWKRLRLDALDAGETPASMAEPVLRSIMAPGVGRRRGRGGRRVDDAHLARRTARGRRVPALARRHATASARSRRRRSCWSASTTRRRRSPTPRRSPPASRGRGCRSSRAPATSRTSRRPAP